jgi:hypothetical protein
MSAPSRLEANDTKLGASFWLYWIATFWALGFAIFTVYLIVQTVLNCLPGAQVMVTLPASQDYPPHSGSLHYSGAAYVVQGTDVTFTQATMLVSHLPISSAILLGLGQIFAAATSAGIAWCVIALVRQLRDDQPFAASTSRALVAAGLILAIGSTASTISTASAQIGLQIAYIAKFGQLTLSGDGTFISLTPLLIAAVLFALAGVFRYGARLERERDVLKHETKGLV